LEFFEHDRFYDLVRTGRCCRIYDSWKELLLATNCFLCLIIHFTGKRIIGTQNPNYIKIEKMKINKYICFTLVAGSQFL
jgi:hypothetical protein